MDAYDNRNQVSENPFKPIWVLTFLLYVTSASLELGNNLNMCQNFRALNEILFSFIFRQDINLHVQIFGQSGNYYEILCSLKAELYYFHKAANVHKEIDKNS